MKIKSINIEEVKFIAFKLAGELMKWNESIPEFSTRFPNVLESCIETPFQTFSKKFLYKGLIEKASILFYLMVKNHPFQNGNKRIAVTTLLVFLHRNKKWILVDVDKLYNFAVDVAKSNPKEKDLVIEFIRKFIKTNLVPIN